MAGEIEDLIRKAMQDSEENETKEVKLPPLPAGFEKKAQAMTPPPLPREYLKNEKATEQVVNDNAKLPPLPGTHDAVNAAQAVAGPAVLDPLNPDTGSRAKKIKRLDSYTRQLQNTEHRQIIHIDSKHVDYKTIASPSETVSKNNTAIHEINQSPTVQTVSNSSADVHAVNPSAEAEKEPEKKVPAEKETPALSQHADSSTASLSHTGKTQTARQKQIQIGEKFYHYLLRIVIVTIGICAVGLGYLYMWLARYEKRSINGAMTNYMYAVQDRKWDQIYEEDKTYFTELNSKESVASYLLTQYANVKAGGVTFAWVETNTDTGMRYYDVYFQREKVGTLECVKPEGSEVWKVRTVVSGGTYTVDVLDNASFTVNGYTLPETSHGESGHIPLFAEGMGIDNLMPETTRYTIENMITPPELVVSSNSDVIIRDYTANHYYIGPKPTADQIEVFSTEIQDTAEMYSKFISQDVSLWQLLQYLYPDTEFYTAMKGFNNQYFDYHSGVEFNNLEVSEIIPFGDYAFMGTISFDFRVIGYDKERTSKTKYQIHFVKDGDIWLATNIITVTEDDDSSDQG